MSNYRIGSGYELFPGRVPLHAVNFACNPFYVSGILSQFGVLGNRQNVVQRIVEAQNYFFSGVRATIILTLKFLANQLRVLSSLKTIHCGFLEITAFTKGIVFPSHSGNRGTFAAVSANTLRDVTSFGSLGSDNIPFTAPLTMNKSVPSRSGTKYTQFLFTQSVVPLHRVLFSISATFWGLSVAPDSLYVLFVVSKFLGHRKHCTTKTFNRMRIGGLFCH